jgi:hypothetical protein
LEHGIIYRLFRAPDEHGLPIPRDGVDRSCGRKLDAMVEYGDVLLLPVTMPPPNV